tara:strand:+ start:236 stop:370 length:135 start_codon:yes stop_codon:yes gene_type:complete
MSIEIVLGIAAVSLASFALGFALANLLWQNHIRGREPRREGDTR